MLIPVSEPLYLTSTLLSGQAFRWRQDGPWFDGVIFGSIVRLREVAGGVELRCDAEVEGAIAPLLRDYLGLGTNLERVYASLLDDERLREAIHRYPGMRILRQDPWECLVSFICSANSSIPQISATLEALARAYGRPLRLGTYVDYPFPTPQRLAQAGEGGLRALKMGFRARYVAQVAERVAQGEVRLECLRKLPYQEAREVLISLPGVGDKVADCVLLFSLDKLEAFPVDRWVHRAVGGLYLGDAKANYNSIRAWASERWGPYAGYAQQYLFHSVRLQG